MAKSARERGLEVLADLFPDPALREQRQTELGDAGLDKLGAAVLRQDDYSRHMNELTTKSAEVDQFKATLDEWYTTRKDQLEELDTLRAAARPNGNGNQPPTPPATPPAGALTKAELEEQIAISERGAIAYIRDMQLLVEQHRETFGRAMTREEYDRILADRRIQQLGVNGVYRDLFKDQLAAKDQEARTKAEEAIRADERQKTEARLASSRHPYPVSGNEPSTLDGLQPPAAQNPALKSVDDMVGEYARLSAARGA